MGKHTLLCSLTCSKQSRVPWYRAAPLWFIMRVRTTSTGLEVKAPARPHTKLDLRASEKHKAANEAKILSRNCSLLLPKLRNVISSAFRYGSYFLVINNIAAGTGSACDFAHLQEVCVHGVPHVPGQDQVLLCDVVDGQLHSDHDGGPLGGERDALSG